MKKFLKIFGICLAIVIVVFGGSIGVYALIGGFKEEVIGMTSIYFGESETDKQRQLIIEDDQNIIINYLPANANDITLSTKLAGDDCIEIPPTVKAGQEFTIRVKKDPVTGRNIGGNVSIEFVSSNKSSISNLITPCKLNITVDVPVESNDLNFSSTLKYISGKDTPNQYIISRNTSSTIFYLYSNKTNIFDINQWSSVDNKEIYFSYVEGESGESINLEYTEGEEVDNGFDPVTCFYNTTKERYEFKFYPERIGKEHDLFTVNAKVHRSYEIQKEFNEKGFSALQSMTELELRNNPDSANLLRSYSEFLDKYYIKYFALGNADALAFFTSLSTSGNVNINVDSNVIENIKKSLDYVFVNNSIEFYISNVKVTGFEVTDSLVTFNLNDETTNSDGTKNYSRTQRMFLFSNQDNIANTFNIYFRPSNNSVLEEAIIQDLLSRIEIDVLVYDGSGKSTMEELDSEGNLVSLIEQQNSNPSDLNNFVNTADNYTDFLEALNKQLPAGTEGYTDFKDLKDDFTKFNKNTQYLKVTKGTLSTTGEDDPSKVYWDFEKLVPSKSNNFQIYLRFTLKSIDEDGPKYFINYAKVNVEENSETIEAGFNQNRNLIVSDTMYVYENEVVAEQLKEKGITRDVQTVKLNQAGTTGNYKTPFNSFKLFAYVGVEKEIEEGKIAVVTDGNSIITQSKFVIDGKDPIIYNILSNKLGKGLDRTRLCRFENLDGDVFVYDKGTTSFETVNLDSVQPVVYAYEISWDEVQALASSDNKVIIFATYVLTDKDNNPINREGSQLFDENGNIILLKQGENVLNQINVSGVGEEYYVNYVTFHRKNATYQTIEFAHKIQVKSVVEKINFYSQVQHEITELLVKNEKYSDETTTKYELLTFNQGDLLYRNDDSKLFEHELKLILGQSYENILYAYPYDINDLTTIKTVPDKNSEEYKQYVALHIKLTNQYNSFLEAVTRENATLEYSFEFGDVTTKLVEDPTPANIYQLITITPTRDTSGVAGAPVIRASENYTNESVFDLIETNSIVSVEIFNINITDFKNVYVGKDDPLKDDFVEGSANEGMKWTNGLFHNIVAHPMFVNTIDGNNLSNTYIENLITNLKLGVNYDNVKNSFTSFKFGTKEEILVQGKDPDIVYSVDAESYSSSIIDISRFSDYEIHSLLLNYLFDSDNIKIDSAKVDGKTLLDYEKTTILPYKCETCGLFSVGTTCPDCGVATQTTRVSNIYNKTINTINNSTNVEYGNGAFSIASGDMWVNVYSLKLVNDDIKVCSKCLEEYDKDATNCSNVMCEENELVSKRTPVPVAEYYKYFDGYAPTTTIYDNKYIKVKVVLDKYNQYTLPLKTNTSHFEFSYDMVWVFGGENVVTKTYNVDVKFKTPIFEQIITGNGYNTNEGYYEINADTLVEYLNVVPLIDKVKAYYEGVGEKPDINLNESIKFSIENTSYAMFSGTGESTTAYGRELLSAPNPGVLLVYNAFEDRIITVIAHIDGAEDIILKFKVNRTLTIDSSAVSSAKLISYTSFGKDDNLISFSNNGTGGTVSYKNDEGKTINIEGINDFDVKPDAKSITYESFNSLLTLKEEGKADRSLILKLDSIGYWDMYSAEYVIVTDDDNDGVIKLLDETVKIALLTADNTQNLVITGEIFIEIKLSFKIDKDKSFGDSYLLNRNESSLNNVYQVMIYPIVKLNRSTYLGAESSGNDKYFYYAGTEKLFTNNSDLYNEIFGFRAITIIGNSNATYEPIANDSKSMIMEVATPKDYMKWEVDGELKEIKEQFNVKSSEEGYSSDLTDLGNVVYNTEGTKNVRIEENTKLISIPAPKTYVLPISIKITDGGFYGDRVNSEIIVLIPVAGYNILYKPNGITNNFVTANYDYENFKFINDNGNNISISLSSSKPEHILTDYLSISYADSALGLIDVTNYNDSNITGYKYLNFACNAGMGGYGYLDESIVVLNNFINDANKTFTAEITGYTLLKKLDAKEYDFALDIEFDINILPSSINTFNGGNIVINNALFATNGITYQYLNDDDLSLESFVLKYFLFEKRDQDGNLVDGNLKISNVDELNNIFYYLNDVTGAYIKFEFDDTAFIDGKIKTDAIDVAFTVYIVDGSYTNTISSVLTSCKSFEFGGGVLTIKNDLLDTTAEGFTYTYSNQTDLKLENFISACFDLVSAVAEDETENKIIVDPTNLNKFTYSNTSTNSKIIFEFEKPILRFLPGEDSTKFEFELLTNISKVSFRLIIIDNNELKMCRGNLKLTISLASSSQ